MNTVIVILKHWMTGRDNISYSFTKLIGLCSAIAMIYNFIYIKSVDFTGFGIGISGIMAALAAKYFVEGSNDNIKAP